MYWLESVVPAALCFATILAVQHFLPTLGKWQRALICALVVLVAMAIWGLLKS